MASLDRSASPSRESFRNYTLVTAAYWTDTLTDGALRMLILFHFYQLGYSTLAVASLFLFYECFGVLTNLFGGYLGQRLGLHITLFLGLAFQLIALLALATVPPMWLTIPYVMIVQALSGIAKDLTKMSSKSAVKHLTGEAQGKLYLWVARLTGSKNAIKGLGFFVGALLLSRIGFQPSLFVLAVMVLCALLGSIFLLRGKLSGSKKQLPFRQMFSHHRAVNVLAAARLLLFGARDVWFVVALPVFLASVFGWSFWVAGGFMALWIIGYGLVQGTTPHLLHLLGYESQVPDGVLAQRLAIWLTAIPILIALALMLDIAPSSTVIAGLILFGVVFALNSAVHSYLILAYTDGDRVATQVGFYYMANALGRLIGTLLSGLLYQIGVAYSPSGGLIVCLWCAALFIGSASLISSLLPRHTRQDTIQAAHELH